MLVHRLNPNGPKVSAAGGQGLGEVLGGLGGELGKFNPLALKEPIVVDPGKAYPTVLSLPGAPFTPVSYATGSIIAQLAHSSDGIVRLPPGDYSIPVRLY
jgi:hypothetical protein